MTQTSCPRPTKSGKSCGNKVYGKHAPACSIHMTPTEKALVQAVWNAYHEGSVAGRKYAEFDITNLREENDKLRQSLKKTNTTYDYEGGQVFQAAKCTWVWRGEGALKVGDKVLTPRPWFLPSDSPAFLESEVIELGSEYKGALASVGSRV